MLRSAILAVAAVAVVGTTLTSAANAQSYWGTHHTEAAYNRLQSVPGFQKLSGSQKRMRERQVQTHLNAGCGYGWNYGVDGKCHMD
jgi:hypothetical protein